MEDRIDEYMIRLKRRDGTHLHFFSMRPVCRLIWWRDLKAKIVIKTEKFECNSVCDDAVDTKDYFVGKPTLLLNPRFTYRQTSKQNNYHRQS